ncbi:uncharacterized protein DS421_20g693850 [Arachis hypogaea]|nr:uncharacterized protein DS421_20g693850 [Arachis hypogaea]
MEDGKVVPTDSQLPEEENVLVPLTQCPTNAQSAPNVGIIDVNPELPVNAARIPVEGVRTTSEGQQGRAGVISDVL